MDLRGEKLEFVEAVLCSRYAGKKQFLHSALKRVRQDENLLDAYFNHRLEISAFDKNLASFFGLNGCTSATEATNLGNRYF